MKNENDDILRNLNKGINWTADWPRLLAANGIDFDEAPLSEIEAFRQILIKNPESVIWPDNG